MKYSQTQCIFPMFCQLGVPLLALLTFHSVNLTSPPSMNIPSMGPPEAPQNVMEICNVNNIAASQSSYNQ